MIRNPRQILTQGFVFFTFVISMMMTCRVMGQDLVEVPIDMDKEAIQDAWNDYQDTKVMSAVWLQYLAECRNGEGRPGAPRKDDQYPLCYKEDVCVRCVDVGMTGRINNDDTEEAADDTGDRSTNRSDDDGSVGRDASGERDFQAQSSRQKSTCGCDRYRLPVGETTSCTYQGPFNTNWEINGVGYIQGDVETRTIELTSEEPGRSIPYWIEGERCDGLLFYIPVQSAAPETQDDGPWWKKGSSWVNILTVGGAYLFPRILTSKGESSE